MGTSIFSFAVMATLTFLFTSPVLVRPVDESCPITNSDSVRIFARGGVALNTSVKSGTSDLYIECSGKPYWGEISCKNGIFIHDHRKINLKRIDCEESKGCSTQNLPVNVGTKYKNRLVKYLHKMSIHAWCLADPSQSFIIWCIESVWMNMLKEGVVLNTSLCPSLDCNASSLPSGMAAISEDGEPIDSAGKKVARGTRLYTSCEGNRSMLNHTIAPPSGEIAYLYSTCYQGGFVSLSDRSQALSEFACVEDTGACLVKDLPGHLLLPNMTFMVKYADQSEVVGHCEENKNITVATFCRSAEWATTPAGASGGKPQPLDEVFVKGQCRKGGLKVWEIALIAIAAVLLLAGAILLGVYLCCYRRRK